MSQPKKEKAVSIRFPVEVLDAIHRLADEDERSLNAEVIWALRQFIAQRKRKAKKEHDDGGLGSGNL